MKPLFTLGETGCHTDKANLTSLLEVTALIHTQHHRGSLSVELTGLTLPDLGSGRRQVVYVRGTNLPLSKIEIYTPQYEYAITNMEERTNRENV